MNVQSPEDDESETPEDKRTFVEGVVDGMVETVTNPFRWVRALLGDILGGGGDSGSSK